MKRPREKQSLALVRTDRTSAAFDYLASASRPSLEALSLARLNSAANIQKEIEELLRQEISELVVAELARVIGLHVPKGTTKLRVEHVRSAAQELLRAKAKSLMAENGEMQPFFAGKELTTEMVKLLTVSERKKWPRYFSRWGCVDCKRKDVEYWACGFCRNCGPKVRRRLKE
jgi:hypothetical protein